LADRIVKLLSDDETYARYSQAALAHSKAFSISACADAHLELYKSLLGSGATAAR
jgi:glycosyltransferase involved in cell wall biosynthesis